jgi:hypothetical protein
LLPGLLPFLAGRFGGANRRSEQTHQGLSEHRDAERKEE